MQHRNCKILLKTCSSSIRTLTNTKPSPRFPNKLIKTYQKSRKNSVTKSKKKPLKISKIKALSTRFLVSILCHIQKRLLLKSWNNTCIYVSNSCDRCKAIQPRNPKYRTFSDIDIRSTCDSRTRQGSTQTTLMRSLSFSENLFRSGLDSLAKIVNLRMVRGFDLILLSRIKKKEQSKRKPFFSASTAFRILHSRLEKLCFRAKLSGFYSLLNYYS